LSALGGVADNEEISLYKKSHMMKGKTSYSGAAATTA
jgi:hypothetical protein